MVESFFFGVVRDFIVAVIYAWPVESVLAIDIVHRPGTMGVDVCAAVGLRVMLN